MHVCLLGLLLGWLSVVRFLIVLPKLLLALWQIFPDPGHVANPLVLGKKDNEIIAYARIFKPGDYFEEASFGRAVVKKSERGKGIGDELVINSIKSVPENKIKISAQSYLKEFYGKHGFVAKGEEYLEDGIPHTAMFLCL